MKVVTRSGTKTDDECCELLLVCGGEVHHGVEDLDAGIGVDIDAALVRCTGKGGEGVGEINPVIGSDIRFSKGRVDSCRADLDGHGRIEGSHSHLEWLKADSFVGENAKLSGIAYADGNTAGETVLIGTEPGVTLGLLEDVMQDGIVSVVVHSGGH